MILSRQQTEKIVELLPEESQHLLAIQDVNELLEFLDVETIALYNENDEPTAESDFIEILRDEIHWDNSYIKS